MDKQQIIEQIGRVQADLAKAEADVRRYEQEAEKGRRNYTGGLIGLLVGVILLITPLFPLGILLALAGGLATISGKSQQNKANTKRQEADDFVVAGKSSLAQLQAQLAAG